MKTAILITSEAKQIMFTPETDAEKEALEMITADDDIHIIIKQAAFSDLPKVFGADIFRCQGGYYRAEEREESVMFVLTSKKKKKQ